MRLKVGLSLSLLLMSTVDAENTLSKSAMDIFQEWIAHLASIEAMASFVEKVSVL
jgi:hypothetical protein